MGHTDANQISWDGRRTWDSDGDGTDASRNAANRAKSHQSRSEATTSEHSQLGVADNGHDSLFVDPASPTQLCGGLVDSDEDEDLPPLSELWKRAQSRKKKCSNNSEKPIIIIDDDDDSLPVPHGSHGQSPEDPVKPKIEDDNGKEFPPSQDLSHIIHSQKSEADNTVTVGHNKDEGDDSLFVSQEGRTQSPADRVTVKNEDNDDDQDKGFGAILDRARQMEGSDHQSEAVTIDDEDIDKQYTTPRLPTIGISSNPDIITINDDDNEQSIPSNTSIHNSPSNGNRDGPPSLQENIVARDDTREKLTAQLTAQQAKRDKLLIIHTRKGSLTAVEQTTLSSTQARIQEIQDRIKQLKERGGTDATADVMKPKTERAKTAKTAKEWFMRENETNKNSIAKKRKILYEEPTAASRYAKQPKLNDMTPDKHLSVRKLQYSNPLKARMAQCDVSNPDGFQASSKKQQRLQYKENAPKDLDPKALAADLGNITRASRSFGYLKCKATNGQWAVDGIKTTLLDHQVIGASWMLEQEFGEDKGGINADEMGMGKTIQTLACIVSNRPGPEDIKAGRTATLVVAPSSATRQWVAEIEKHTAHPYFDDVHIFKKSKEESLNSLKKRDIIITSYTEVANSYIPPKARKLMESDGCSPEDHRRLSEEHLGPLFRIPFWRVILDEAHAIKSSKTQSHAACQNIDATYRWCLTGTPIMNSAEEIWPYLSFLQVNWAQSLRSFRRMLGNLEIVNNQKRLKAIIKTVVLRRTMDDTLMGKRLYSVPDCFVEVKSFPLSKEEEFVYRVVEARYRNIVNHMLKKYRERRIIKEPSELQLYIVFLTRLRQATAHPFLLEIVLKKDLAVEDLQLIEEYLREHGGRTSVIHQVQEWRDNNLDVSFSHSDIGTFGKSQFGHNLRMDEHISSAIAWKDETLCSLCLKLMENPESAECGHGFCSQCIEREVARNQAKHGKARCPICDKPLSNLRPINPTSSANCSSSTTSSGRDSPNQEADEVDEGPNLRRKMSEARTPKLPKKVGRDGRELGNDYYNRKPPLKPEYTMFLRDSDQRYPEPMVPSAKTTIVKETVVGWIAEAPHDKIIIFTQFLEESQIIGRMLQAEGINFAYYFGDLSTKKRDVVINDFHNNKEIQVLVASLKCGGVALNITCANRVILTDPWWNSPTELQAYCRVFRIGQKKTTHFVSLLAEKTIDARIAKLQAAKLRSVEQALQYRKSISLDDFASLLGYLKEDENGNKIIAPDFPEE